MTKKTKKAQTDDAVLVPERLVQIERRKRKIERKIGSLESSISYDEASMRKETQRGMRDPAGGCSVAIGIHANYCDRMGSSILDSETEIKKLKTEKRALDKEATDLRRPTRKTLTEKPEGQEMLKALNKLWEGLKSREVVFNLGELPDNYIGPEGNYSGADYQCINLRYETGGRKVTIKVSTRHPNGKSLDSKLSLNEAGVLLKLVPRVLELNERRGLPKDNLHTEEVPIQVYKSPEGAISGLNGDRSLLEFHYIDDPEKYDFREDPESRVRYPIVMLEQVLDRCDSSNSLPEELDVAYPIQRAKLFSRSGWGRARVLAVLDALEGGK